MRPLKVDIQSWTTQKDAMLAEKTALKNEVLYNSFTVCSGARARARDWRNFESLYWRMSPSSCHGSTGFYPNINAFIIFVSQHFVVMKK